MKWEDQEDVVDRKEAIQVLMDGIHQNIDEDELEEFAEAHNIPYVRQKPKSFSGPYVDSNGDTVSQTPFVVGNLPDDDEDDEDAEDDYDESDDYYQSSY